MQLARPWVRSQQNGIKGQPPQNIIMACKMRREKEDVCSILFGKYRLHVWSGFIRLLVDAMAQKLVWQRVWVLSLTEARFQTTTVLRSLPSSQRVGLRHFLVKFIRWSYVHHTYFTYALPCT